MITFETKTGGEEERARRMEGGKERKKEKDKKRDGMKE